MNPASIPSESAESVPEMATDAVLIKSVPLPKDTPKVQGYDFAKGPLNYDHMFESFATQGFQGTSFSRGVDEINRMLNWRLSDEPISKYDAEEFLDKEFRKSIKCTIFLGFTSNQISCGNREVIRYLAEKKLIQCMVTTAGAIEEDLMKCFNPHYLGRFNLPGRQLRLKGQNRIGNLIVPNQNYVDFEEWLEPILIEMLQEQKEKGTIWTPSSMIKLLGQKIDNESSVLYWAAKNDIPIFCPAITDGSIGDNLFFMSFKHPGLILDIVQDIRGINQLALDSKGTGMIILGGGLVKHHICNANLMRNGANFSVFVNTGQEFDGSDSGAKPDEAISWGKIKLDASPVKIYADASFIFPLLVSQTFYKHEQKGQKLKVSASTSVSK